MPARGTRPEKHGASDVGLSKALSYMLRHGARAEAIPMDSKGYVTVEELLKHNRFKGYREGDIVKVVEANAKQRFSMTTDAATGKSLIRANQGHTLDVPDLDLEPILDPSDIPVVVHGTYERCLESIRHSGLSRMKRQHIHCASGLPKDDGVISGMRSSCTVLVYVDAKKAMRDGIKFYRSANGVVLSPGNEDGFIAPKYFQKVVMR